jgi:hypothetical protein
MPALVMQTKESSLTASPGFRFVLILGVSSIIGPFLSASAAAIGMI